MQQRIAALDEALHTEETRALVAQAERDGAPDPRIAEVFVRIPVGRTWMTFWRELMQDGLLPHRLKEMVRLHMSFAHKCGYCASVRSATAREQGLTEAVIAETLDFENSAVLTQREKAALRFGLAFKEGRTTEDAVYDDLRQHFEEEEVLELAFLCWQIAGGGPMVKLVNLVSWDEACELNPSLGGAAGKS